jgi:O-antigen ligase
MFKKIQNALLLLFVFLLPIQTVLLLREPIIDGTKWQYGTIGLYGTDLLLLATLAAWTMTRPWPSFVKKLRSLSLGEGALIALVMWAALSVTWSPDPILSAYSALRLALAAGVFFLAKSVRMPVLAGAVVFALAGAALLEAWLGIWQFLSQGSFRSVLLGMSAYEPWQAGVSVLKNESGRWLRAYGTLPHPNMLGGYLAAMLSVIVGYLVLKGKSWLGANESGYRLFWSAAALWSGIVTLGLILSFSRSAWLGAALALGALVSAAFLRSDANGPDRSETERKGWRKKVAHVLGTVVLSAVVFVSVLHEVVLPRFDGETVSREGSVTDRAALAAQAWELVREHPLAGVGIGNETLATTQAHPEIPVWEVQPAHNVFLLVLAEVGAVGLVLFLAFLFGVFRSEWHIFAPVAGSGGGSAFFFGLVALVPSLMLDHFLWSSHFGLLLFFLLAGLSCGGARGPGRCEDGE